MSRQIAPFALLIFGCLQKACFIGCILQCRVMTTLIIEEFNKGGWPRNIFFCSYLPLTSNNFNLPGVGVGTSEPWRSYSLTFQSLLLYALVVTGKCFECERDWSVWYVTQKRMQKSGTVSILSFEVRFVMARFRPLKSVDAKCSSLT